MKRRCPKGRKGERGQVLLLVMILMLVGGIIITPLLSYMSTGLMSGRVFENKADELYAADSGVEDGLWQIKNSQLSTKFSTYDPYDYSTTSWNYNLNETVNGKSVSVNIQNVWIPQNLQNAPPDKTHAHNIIEGVSGQVPKVIVTGTATLPCNCTVKITYSPTVGETFTVTTLGVWLPSGFTYVAGSSNLGTEPTTSAYDSGQAVVWSFSPAVAFTSLPGVYSLASPMIATITFQFSTTQPGQSPAAVSWINTNLNLSGGYTYAWDADKKIYHITSTAGGTTVDAYAIKLELRQLGSAISGDYYATGNTLMRCTNSDQYGTRNVLDPSSSANVSAIPQDAQVAAAYLYWTAWRGESAKITPFSDPCSSNSSFNTNWVNGGDWAYYSSGAYYRAHHSGTNNSTRYLTLKTSLSLTYTPGTVMVSWQQAEDGTLGSGDALLFSFSGDGGVTWSGDYQAFSGTIGSSWVGYNYTIPSQYLTSSFEIRFYISGFSSSGQYCRLDNIAITVMPPDTSVNFSINGQQVYFDASGNTQKGSQPITASKTQVLPNFNSDGITPNGYSYSCYKDVTKLVQAYSTKAPNPATNYPGNGIYTVGSVTGDTGNQWSYAGWSLIIIYTSPSTLGHQLYLFDTFLYAGNKSDVNFGSSVVPYGGTISGFLVPQPVSGETNAAKLTACVAEGDYCWSGDFIAFNAPSSYWNSTSSNPWSIPDPTSTNPWKLYDGVPLAAPGDTQNKPNNASQPDNVWNSHPADGLDIKTFNITWASVMLKPGDTSAHVDLPTYDDSWNLVYIILSFRSATTTGGTISYLIRG